MGDNILEKMARKNAAWDEYDRKREERSNLLRGYDTRITNPEKYGPSTLYWREKSIKRIEQELNEIETKLLITLTSPADLSLASAIARNNQREEKAA